MSFRQFLPLTLSNRQMKGPFCPIVGPVSQQPKPSSICSLLDVGRTVPPTTWVGAAPAPTPMPMPAIVAPSSAATRAVASPANLQPHMPFPRSCPIPPCPLHHLHAGAPYRRCSPACVWELPHRGARRPALAYHGEDPTPRKGARPDNNVTRSARWRWCGSRSA
jgi:hypothetical protein